jgi:DNA-binding NarL/FixJ family response regulator
VAIVTGTELTGLLAAGSLRAEVVVLDLELDDGIDGTDLVAPVCEAGATVLVCTAETARHRLGVCIERGAAGVVSKSQSTEEVLEAIRTALRGESVMRPARREELLAERRAHMETERARLAPFADLTPREQAVLAALMDGVAPAAIAAASGAALKTVRHQTASIMLKLGVRSQLAAAALARQRGWTPPGPLSRRTWNPDVRTAPRSDDFG